MNQLGLTHLSLRVDDLVGLLASLRAAGVRILDRTRIDIPAFEAGAVFVTDPDGTSSNWCRRPVTPARRRGVGGGYRAARAYPVPWRVVAGVLVAISRAACRSSCWSS